MQLFDEAEKLPKLLANAFRLVERVRVSNLEKKSIWIASSGYHDWHSLKVIPFRTTQSGRLCNVRRQMMIGEQDLRNRA